MDIKINEQRVIQLLSDLVKIDSINPTLVLGGGGETAIATYLVDYLQRAGIEAHLQEAAPGRPNAIGILRGTGGGKTLMIDSHMDTVAVEGMEEPFSGRIADGKIWGRGAGDDKSGVAASVEAIIAIKEAGLPLKGDLIIAGVADEEYGSVGTETLVRDYKADGCIIGEPSRLAQGLNLGIGVGSGGYVWSEVEITGRTAHGSLYDVGIDAIEQMGAVLTALSGLKRTFLAQAPYRNPMATYRAEHKPSIHASLITGGIDLATYPDRCLLSLERRMVYGETYAQHRAELEELVAEAKACFPQVDIKTRVLFERPPWEAKPGPLLDLLNEEVTAELGEAPKRYAVAGWDDGAITSEAGIPTVVFGPSGNYWHANGEYADAESLVRCARAMARTAARFCA